MRGEWGFTARRVSRSGSETQCIKDELPLTTISSEARNLVFFSHSPQHVIPNAVRELVFIFQPAGPFGRRHRVAKRRKEEPLCFALFTVVFLKE